MAISDVLSEAVIQIDEYLFAPHTIYGVEGDPVHDRIVKCRNEMDSIRRVLDTPPVS